jgi:hypothetical protein
MVLKQRVLRVYIIVFLRERGKGRKGRKNVQNKPGRVKKADLRKTNR